MYNLVYNLSEREAGNSGIWPGIQQNTGPGPYRVFSKPRKRRVTYKQKITFFLTSYTSLHFQLPTTSSFLPSHTSTHNFLQLPISYNFLQLPTFNFLQLPTSFFRSFFPYFLPSFSSSFLLCIEKTALWIPFPLRITAKLNELPSSSWTQLLPPSSSSSQSVITTVLLLPSLKNHHPPPH